MSSISRVLRARFGRKEDEDDCDKKDDNGEKKTKHSIDGILGEKGKKTTTTKTCRIRDTFMFTAGNLRDFVSVQLSGS